MAKHTSNNPLRPAQWWDRVRPQCLMDAVTNCDVQALRFQLSIDKDCIRKCEASPQGRGLLSVALIGTFTMEMVRLLVENGADIHIRSEIEEGQMPPLQIAVLERLLDVFYYLLRRGADIDQSRSLPEDNEDVSRDYDFARDWADRAAEDRDPCFAQGTSVYGFLLEEMEDAGSWNEYVAGLRMPYILIRRMAVNGQLQCEVDDKKMQLWYQFVFVTAPDDIFGVIASYLGVRLVDYSRRWDDSSDSE